MYFIFHYEQCVVYGYYDDGDDGDGDGDGDGLMVYGEW